MEPCVQPCVASRCYSADTSTPYPHPSAGIGIFQDVTMRLIAERLLEDAAGTTYVDGELISHKLKALPPPKDEHKFHICYYLCSPHQSSHLHDIPFMKKITVLLRFLNLRKVKSRKVTLKPYS